MILAHGYYALRMQEILTVLMSKHMNWLPAATGVAAVICLQHPFFSWFFRPESFLWLGGGLLALAGAELGAEKNALSRPYPSWLTHALLFFTGAILLATLCAKLVPLASGYAHALNVGYFTSLIDGREALKIWLLSHGKSIYPDLSDSPYIVTLYTPLFHMLVSSAYLAIKDLILACHVVNYIAFLCLYLLCAFWLRRRTGALFTALTLPALMITGGYFGDYGLSIRPDLLAWLLAYASLFVFSSALPEKRALHLAVVLASLAMLTKQQTLPIFLASASSFLIRERPRRFCLAYAAQTAFIGLAAFAALQWLTDGGFFIHAIQYPARLSAMESITNIDNAIPRFLGFFILYAPLILCWAFFFSRSLMKRKLHYLDWAILWQLPFLAPLVSTWGADGNYFLGLIIALSLRTGLALGEGWLRNDAGKALYLAVAIFMTGGLLQLPQAFSSTPSLSFDPETIQNVKKAATGRVLINAEGAPAILSDADDPDLSFFDGTETQFFDQSGLWSFKESKLAKDIADRRFDVVILRTTFFDPQLTRLTQTYYRLRQSYGDFKIYEPRPGQFSLITEFPPMAFENGSLSLEPVSSSGIDYAASFGAFEATKNENAAQGELVFWVSSRTPFRRAAVQFYPKVAQAGPENALELFWSEDATNYHPLQTYASDGKDNARGLFDPKVEAEFSPKSRTFYLKFILKGSAQLWTSPQSPMTITLADDGAAKENSDSDAHRN